VLVLPVVVLLVVEGLQGWRWGGGLGVY
jgi:hypothetical protein